jgi:hypothetical protein
LQYLLTRDVGDIAMIMILRMIVRSKKAISKINGTPSQFQYIRKTSMKFHNINIVGPIKINNDIIESINPLAITDLFLFFIDLHNLNVKILMARQKIKQMINIDKHIVPNSISGPGFERKTKTVLIMKNKRRITSTKNSPDKTKYSFSNFEIIFGLSSILYSLYKKYNFTGINIFGRLSVIVTVSMLSSKEHMFFKE